ncbi:hypothetical protein ACWCPF_00930 [Streptomyces sp. NPDC001858]
MIRFRIQVADWPRRALVLTDTPQPHCPDCQGEGWIPYHYGDEHGEYADTGWDPCDCWDDTRRFTLLPLPHLLRRLRRHTYDGRDPWGPGGYSDEPPF